jgi:hypothetical protein
MRRKISVAEVLATGVDVKPEEAIAIAQQLIHPAPPRARPSTGGGEDDAVRAMFAVDRTRMTAVKPRDAAIDAPHAYGPPSAENVFLETDGSVSCTACDVTPAVSEAARFLQQLLPPDGVRIPGSLRYTIARALLEVDAPPYDSLADFSEALERYERGSRADHVCRVLDRARTALARESDAPPVIDRRRLTSEIFELRRQLRESDERLYDQQRAIDTLVAGAASPSSRQRRPVVAAGIGIGLMLAGAGELMQSRHHAGVVAPPAAVAAAVEAEDDAAEPPAAALPIVEPAVARPAANEGRAPEDRPGSRLTKDGDVSRVAARPAVKTTPRIAKVSQTTTRERPSRRGVLDRLHLSWLRTKIAIRHDDL